MNFEIGSSEQLAIDDSELSELLQQVYVSEGYTPSGLAERLFAPDGVRSRGKIFAARESLSSCFAGMVIVASSDSPARVLAKGDECEMHLLGVKAEYRGFNLGRNLVEVALEYAKERGWSKMILWTQKSMVSAQNLYESCGFEQTGVMTKNEIAFLVYEKVCT